MARSQESFNKKEVRNKKEKKRKEKEKKKLARKEGDKKKNFDDMIAYVDENGMITSTPPDPSKKKDIKLEDIMIAVPGLDTSDEMNSRVGTVAYFNELKGYGFIRDKETKENIFVHINNLLDEIKVGHSVSFEIENGKRGLSAINVKRNK